MRALGLITVLVLSALAVSPAFAQVPGLPKVEVPEVQVPGVEVPGIEVPGIPLPVPSVVPELPLPLPVEPQPTPGGGGLAPPPPPPPPPAAAGGEPAAPAARAQSPAASQPRGGATGAPAARRGASSPPSRQARARAERRRTASRRAAQRVRPRATPEPATAVSTPRPAATPREAAPAGRPGPAARLADDLGELVDALPAPLLWSLGGMAALALGLAGNAFWQSRQRVALEAQREELLGDVGLLSSALLPTVPDDLEGLTVSAGYRPADGPAAGGDFYDVFELDDGRVGVVLGDVSGHGRQSLRQAALARYTLRTLLAAGHAPGAALAHADRLLVRDLGPDFVTVIAAIYDPPSGELTYAKAGHPPPIVLGTDHDPGEEEPACPLGIGIGDSWPEYRITLSEGVSVCLFTDGLEDARVDGTRLGRDEVERLLAEQDEPDAERLLGDVRALADTVADDTTAVVLRHAPAPVAAPSAPA